MSHYKTSMFKAIFRDFWATQAPISLTPIDRYTVQLMFKAYVQKFQALAMFFTLATWQDMQDKFNYASPLNTVP